MQEWLGRLLLAAIEHRHCTVVKELIRLGAAVHFWSGDYHVRSPLHQAISMGCTEIVKLLISAGADVNSVHGNSGTALMLAASNATITEILLSAGANVDMKDPNGCTALHRAASGSSLEVVELLLRNGADINAKNNSGMTPLSFALSSAANTGSIEAFRFLEERGGKLGHP